MQFRVDKNSGNKLSVLGFGCMRFPKTFGSIDMQKTEELVMEAIHGGVNYFDTAYLYPGSEEAVGTILEKHKVREWVFIASKLPLILLRGPEDFDKIFTKQLERLKTTYIDYYLMHMLTNMDLWAKLQGWGIENWIKEKKEAGKIRQIGFSFHGSQPEFFKLLEAYPWEFCQIQYNYSGESFQAGIMGLKKAAEKISVMVMEPLLGGKLATGLPKAAADIFRRANPELSPAAWGLRWVWNQPEVTLLLSGMNDITQLKENLKLADTGFPSVLTEAEHEAYRQVLEVFNSAYKIRCTGCNYCMPCPRNVDIPGCFAAYNTSFSMGFVTGMHQYITSTGLSSERISSPKLCVKCGICETHCPQHLSIIKSLELVKRKMEPFWLQGFLVIMRTFFRKAH
jgi:predicted aldo/keto reductase-like oxidoreductase